MLRQTAAALVLAVILAFSGGAMGAAPRANAQARVALDRTLPAINFEGIPLKDAIEFLRDVSGANLHVNWRAIELVGITPETPITLKLRQVSLRKVLNLILSEAAGGPSLTFLVDGGVIQVTTREISDNIMYTQVYPVQDLLFEAPVIEVPPDFSLNANGSEGRNNRDRRSRDGGGGASGLFGGGGGGGGGAAAPPREKDAKANELVQLIVETVQPDVWIQNGGKASIRFFNGMLIVTAPRSVHEAIGGPID